MLKADFGFIQGRLTKPPSKKILQYFPSNNWREEFSLARKLNLRFIEYIGERKFNKENPIWSVKGLNEIKSLAKKNKMINYTFCDDYFINNSFLRHKNFKHYIKKITKILSYLKIKIYVLAMFEKSHIEKKNIKNYVNKLKYFSKELKSKKIKLALETNLESKQLNKLMRLVNKKNFFIVYDTGNRLNKKIYQYDEIIKLKKYICHVHLKDKDWKKRNVVLGKGKVKFKEIFKALKKIGYKGKFTFETNRGNDPISVMKKNKKYILNILRRNINEKK